MMWKVIGMAKSPTDLGLMEFTPNEIKFKWYNEKWGKLISELLMEWRTI